MEKEYSYKKFKQDLDNGFQIYLTYTKNRYLIFKTTQNCYTLLLMTEDPKNPQPKMLVITLKRLKEIFKFSTELEYKI